MSNEVKEITSKTFDQFIAENKVVLIDCWAPWCGPCRWVSPIVEKLANLMGEKVAFGKLDVDDNRGIARKFGIMGIPTLLMFNNGKLVEKIVGVKSKRHISKVLKRQIES
jgi:thioredoxin 1